MQTCSSASICFVIPSIFKVKKLCEGNILDTGPISILKKKITHVSEIWGKNLCIYHKVAFFLYPPAINIQENDTYEIKNFILTKMEELNFSYFSQQTPTTSDSPIAPSPHSPAISSSKNSDTDSPIYSPFFPIC